MHQRRILTYERQAVQPQKALIQNGCLSTVDTAFSSYDHRTPAFKQRSTPSNWTVIQVCKTGISFFFFSLIHSHAVKERAKEREEELHLERCVVPLDFLASFHFSCLAQRLAAQQRSQHPLRRHLLTTLLHLWIVLVQRRQLRDQVL